MNVSVLDRIADALPHVSSAGAAVTLCGVTKAFGAHHVLQGIDLDIALGEFVAIVGRSGCGKSTLLRLIAGLDAPSSGTITVDRQSTGWRDDVRLMFQEPRLLPWQRVVANVEVGLTHSRDRHDRRRHAEDTLVQVGLAGRAHEWPTVLSGGQKQRVALARALVNRPRVLLLDEPLGALDLKLRREMQLELKQLQSRVGITFIYVTHDQEEALTMSDRIAVLNQGQIEQVGSPIEVYERPRTGFVAGFIGVSNLIERDGSLITVRPEKITLLADGQSEPAGSHAEAGVIREVSYTGVLTRYIVDLDGGGELVVARQNSQAPPQAHDGRGQRVRIAWQPDQAATIPQV
jgi:putative spermidine/putrescine transport system ATP-binding protein